MAAKISKFVCTGTPNFEHIDNANDSQMHNVTMFHRVYELLHLQMREISDSSTSISIDFYLTPAFPASSPTHYLQRSEIFSYFCFGGLPQKSRVNLTKPLLLCSMVAPPQPSQKPFLAKLGWTGRALHSYCVEKAAPA